MVACYASAVAVEDRAVPILDDERAHSTVGGRQSPPRLALANEFAAVFLFLCDPSIEATNARSERAIRPGLVTRKVCGGNRTRKGADTQQTNTISFAAGSVSVA